MTALKPREAKLRAQALASNDHAAFVLYERAFRSIIYNRPRFALIHLRRAKAHILKAERALLKWAGQ